MISSQSLSMTQKQKLWRQHKEDKFKEMAGDQCALFNYFYNNNDIFKFIDDFDFNIYSAYLYKVMDLQSNIFIGSIATVLLFDRLILNRFYPNIRFKEWRLTANLIKIIVWPTILFKITDHYFLQPYREELFKIQEKYRFGFDDYLKGNLFFDRALAVNRLEELLQKRDKFDWEGVPQLQ